MTYEDACKSTFSREEVIREINKHSLDPAEFFEDVGETGFYPGKVVLDWLGY